MADIKTHLRELSIGLAFYKNETVECPNQFLIFCKKFIKGTSDLRLSQLCEDKNSFNQNELNILKRGEILGKRIKKYILNNQNADSIIWTGSNTQSGTASDLIINDIHFSLKEESFILKNMGLYNYLNIILNVKKYKRGLHCFEEFAIAELELWFQAARDSIIKRMNSKFSHKGKKYFASAVILDNDLQLNLSNRTQILKNFSSCTYNQFKSEISSNFKEKVFSKLVKRFAEDDKRYSKAKRLCALKAGKNIEKLLMGSVGTSPNITDWFRIENREYFYCKVSGKGTSILKVPSKENFNKSVIIKRIESSVPKHQLNIITTLLNTNNGVTFKFRNECRYSHGQLNGTPESKSYYMDNANKLEFAYDKVI